MLCGSLGGTTVGLMNVEIDRILRTPGLYLSITYGIPERRICYLSPPSNNEYRWKMIKSLELPGQSASDTGPGNVDYAYIMQKE